MLRSLIKKQAIIIKRVNTPKEFRGRDLFAFTTQLVIGYKIRPILIKPNAVETHTGGFRLKNKLLPVVAGKVLPVLVLTIITILFSRKLSYTDYGLFQTTWVYANIIGVVIGFGVSSIILSTNFIHFVYFIKANLRRVMIFYAATWLVTFIVFYIVANDLSSTTRLLLIAFILLQNIGAIADALFIKKEQTNLYLFINLVFSILFFIVHLYFYFEPFVLDHLLICIIILCSLKAGSIFFLKKGPATDYTEQPEIPIAGNWVFTGINEVAGIVARWLDKLFLLYLLSPAAFAVFFNGAIEIPIFGILVSAIGTVMLNNIGGNLADKKNAMDTFRESFKILSLLAFPLFFFFLLMHAELFSVIFNNRYNASIPVFVVSIFIIPVRISHYGVLLQCYGQSHKITLGALLDIGLSILLMVVLFPLLGTPGVALAIVISTYLQALFYLWQSGKILNATIKELVPLQFLVVFFASLSLLYSFLYFIKQYMGVITSLLLVFCITSFIIIAGLVAYWKNFNRKLLPA